MSIFKQYATDAMKETEGVKIPYGTNKDGSEISFTISRMGKTNKAYSKALEATTRPYRRQIEVGTMDNETAEKLFKKVFVDTILKGWEHVQDEDGKEIPFTKENALKLFDQLPELYEDLQKQAGSVSTFRAETLESEAGN